MLVVIGDPVIFEEVVLAPYPASSPNGTSRPRQYGHYGADAIIGLTGPRLDSAQVAFDVHQDALSQNV